MKIKDKVCIVTGSASGIGRAIVEFILPYVGLWIAVALFSCGLIVSLLLLLDTSLLF